MPYEHEQEQTENPNPPGPYAHQTMNIPNEITRRKTQVLYRTPRKKAVALYTSSGMNNIVTS
jgi:hypothetical protein